uniref:Uncharacterized protein n=1 Tax=Anguilla anguilla TaxID=7936 RepID=A0A0E9PIJ9_ANGAN
MAVYSYSIQSIYTAGYLLKQLGLSALLKGAIEGPVLGIKTTTLNLNA